MRVLGIDPGSVRLGWAVVERSEDNPDPIYIDSGVISTPRNGMDFQIYRLLVIQRIFDRIGAILHVYRPEEVVNETVPAVGGGNFVAATLSYLANTSATVVQTLGYQYDKRVSQISARTVQSHIAITKRKTKHVTKQQVRNGVLALLPELEPRKSDWLDIFEEPDAIAITLSKLGFRN